MTKDAKKCDKLSRGGFLENTRETLQEDLFELIRANFPKLDPADISRAAEQLAGFDRTELEMLFHPGKFITGKGKRVQAAYLRAAPAVYKLINSTAARTGHIVHRDLNNQKELKGQKELNDQIGQKSQDFHKWLSIASKTSKLSFSCFEGFFDSSVVILRKKGPEGLSLLEEWTEIGGSIAEKNNQLAIVYFNHTADLITSTNLIIDAASFSASSPSIRDTASFDLAGAGGIFTDPGDLEGFREFIRLGEKFAGSNARVAEAYFENLPDVLALLSPEDFQIFHSIIDRLLNVQWTVAVDILATAKNVFSSIPQRRRKELLTVLNEFTGCLNSFPNNTGRDTVVMALFKNTPAAMAKFDEKSFGDWVSIAKEIINVSVDAAISFLNRSPGVFMSIEIYELRRWAEKGITSLSSEKQAFESFYENSFRGLERHLKNINDEERELLLDIGAGIALISPGCTGSYFENSPVALRLLSNNEFKVWVDIGVRISKESSSLGSGYFKNSVSSFRKISPSYYGEILDIAEFLLEKDWLLAGKFFENLPYVAEKLEYGDIREWADIGTKVYDSDRNLAVDYFTYSPALLADLDVFELDEWALRGLEIFEDNTALGRPYFSLKSRSSKDFIEELAGGIALKKVANILRYFAMGLSGTGFQIRSKKELPGYSENDPINPVVSGRTIYLEPKIKKYGSFEDNFKIYKLSIMHEVGHAQFSSPKLSSETLCELLNEITERYGHEETDRMSQLSRDKFSGNMVGFSGEIDISSAIAMFPNKVLAADILGILEDARVEYLIMDLYRGVRSDLESIRNKMLLARPVPEGELEKLMEDFLWLSTLHEPSFELTEENRPILDSMRVILQNRVLQSDSSTLTSLEATLTIYSLFENLLGPLEHQKYEMLKNIEYRGMGLGSFSSKGLSGTENHRSVIRKFIPESVPEREDYLQTEKGRSEKERTEKGKTEKKPICAADKNWKLRGSYRYDEWDYVINDYKSEWCTVNEIEPVGGSGEYYRGASERYRNEIALIKNVFTRMKPESFHRLKGQTDGTEIDIDAFSDALIERRCGINPDEKLYVRWDKRKRDVATLFLVDVSASTRKRLRGEEGNIEKRKGIEGGRSNEERRGVGEKGSVGERRSVEERRSIIDVEKDALVIMAQALDTIGDKYAIYGFSGHTKEDVEYYIIKEFDEDLSGNVEQRISLLEPVANTRLGPAIRHSIKKLEQVSASTKIIILLSDGEPYDTCYGEGAYQGKLAEEDTKIAIQEGNAHGIHFFCITVDSSPGSYLDSIFSDFGYTVIDDARILPERLPLLYKRITT